MSRRRNRRPQPNRPTAVSQPQDARAGVAVAPRQPNIRPGGVNFQPVSDKVISAMYQHMGPQKNVDTMFSPGAPIRPIAGLTPPGGPRGFVYPVGVNIAALPRSTEQYSFADLRALASMYDGIQLCQQVWFDYISKLELVIEPIPSLITANQDISEYEDDIQTYLDFFAYPDKEHDLKSWMRMAVRDQLEIDALSIYVRKDRAGRPYSLDIIDGSMIKPLVDDRGRRPIPPFPAYEQFWNGLPACLLTSDDLIYVKETERSDSVYGRSRVERIILKINQALRKQTKDLARFTDGTVPAGIIEPDMEVSWSQEEIEAFEIQFNNLMAGNDEQRARIKVLPRGFIYKPTDDKEIHIDLDQFILNVTAACHGITMAELAFTLDVNRSTGDSQENVVYRRAMGPLMARYAELFTMILHKFFKERRFVCRWKGFEEHEDFQMRVNAYSTLTNAAILSPSRAAHLLHLPVDVEVPSPIYNTKTGPVLLEDLVKPDWREAGLQAMAGNTAPGEEDTDETSQDTSGAKVPPKAKNNGVSKRVVQQALELADAEDNSEGADEYPNINSGEEEEEESPAVKRLMIQVQDILARLEKAEAGNQLTLPPTEKDVVLELNRWKGRAVDDIKENRSLRGFMTTIIPEWLYTQVYEDLRDCETVDAVREAFRRAKAALNGKVAVS